MKYVSDVTGKIYDTVEDLEKAELEVAEMQKKKDELKAKRADRAKEVEDAYKAALEAQKEADKLMKAFVKDYGSFHMSLHDTLPGYTSLIDYIFNQF